MIRSDNTGVNQADGINDDGSQNVRIMLNKAPHPPKTTVTLVKPVTHGNRIPKWVNKVGADITWWSSHAVDGLYKSIDYGATWTKVMNSPDAVAATSLMVTDAGIVIWGTGAYYFFKSDPAKTTWTAVYGFDVGTFSHAGFGHYCYKNIVLMSNYGDKNATPNPNKAMLSVDYGASFFLIYNGGLMPGYHMHDVAYDPWNSRIWISEGDETRRQVLYSDDYGTSWVSVWSKGDGTPDYGKGIQPTQIVPFKDGVLFGSDQNPDGLSVWKRPYSPLCPTVRPSDIVQNTYLLNDKDTLTHLFQRGWYNFASDTIGVSLFNVSTVGAFGLKKMSILATLDGKDFYEIWKDINYGITDCLSITGPHPDDPQQRFFARVTTTDDGDCYVKGSVPIFS